MEQLTETAQFNNSYAYVASEIERILREAQTPLASDNENITRDLQKAICLIEDLQGACGMWEIYHNVKTINELKDNIINSKKLI